MYSSPPRKQHDIEDNNEISKSLRKSFNKRKSIKKTNIYTADSCSSDEDKGERDSFRVQRVLAKVLASDAGNDGISGSCDIKVTGQTPRGEGHRGFRVFPELPESPQRIKKQRSNMGMMHAKEGITGLCVPGQMPYKFVTILDYSFSSSAVSVFAGQTIVFSLSKDVPTHVEHVLEGICEENSELCFVSPLLQVISGFIHICI